jgi:hypothetical protein
MSAASMLTFTTNFLLSGLLSQDSTELKSKPNSQLPTTTDIALGIAAAPRYTASAQTAHKTPLRKALPLLSTYID